MITRLFPVLRFFMLLCLMGWGNVMMSGQNYQDSLPPGETYGLRLLSFQVEEDNYSGFEDGSEKKLNKAVKALNDKLSSSAQAGFKAYDLGLYRVAYKNESAIKKEITDYVNSIKNLSNYYFLTVKVWSSGQQLNDFYVYFKLPETLPVFEIISEDDLKSKVAEFISIEHKKRNENVSRVKESQAEGVKKLVDLLNDNKVEKLSYDGSENLTSFDETESEEIITFFTPGGQLCAISINLAKTRYIKCDNLYNPMGALARFYTNNQWYHGWWSPSLGKFVGYAPEASNGGPVKPYSNEVFLPNNIQQENVHIGINTQSGNAKFTQIRVVQFTGPITDYILNNGIPATIKRHLPHTTGYIVKNVTPPIAVSETCFNVGGLPEKKIAKKFWDIATTYSNNTSAVQINEAFQTGCVFLDLTGKFSEFKAPLADYPDNVTDVVITSFQTPSSNLEQLKNTLANPAALTRAVVWTHIDSEGRAWRKVVLPTSFQSKYDSKTIEQFMVTAEQVSDGKAIGDNTKSENGYTFLNFLGLSRMFFTTVNEIIEKGNLSDPKYWDYGKKDTYFLGGTSFYDLLGKVGFDKLIAIGCGVSTATKEAVEEQLETISSLNQVASFIFDTKYREEVLTDFNQTISDLQNEEMRKFLFGMLKQALSKEISEALTNQYKQWYYGGYFLTNIAIGALTGGGLKQLKETFDLSKQFRDRVSAARNLAKRFSVSNPKITNLLANMFKSKSGKNLDVTFAAGNNDAPVPFTIKQNGADLVQVNENGKVVNPQPSNGDNIKNHGEVLTGADGNEYIVAETADDKWVIIAGKIDDDFIKKILRKHGMPDNAQYVQDLKNKFVSKIGGEKAAKFLNDDIAKAFAKLGNDPQKKMELFEDLGSTYNTPDGIGKLVDDIDKGGISEGIVEAWDEAFDNISLRINSSFLTSFSGILKNMAKTMNHVKYRDLSIPHRKGIGGCHDLVEWNKLRRITYSSGYTPPIGKKITDIDIPESIIVTDLPHSVPGVRQIEYQIPAIDGKVSDATGRTIGYTTGALKRDGSDNFKKTVYDPNIWTDAKLETALKEAIKDHANKNGGKIENIFTGKTKQGYKIRGYFRSGEVDSFFFD